MMRSGPILSLLLALGCSGDDAPPTERAAAGAAAEITGRTTVGTVAGTGEAAAQEAAQEAKVPGGPAPAAPRVIISEIHYHPPEGRDAEEEFVELHNRADAEVDLAGWEVRGGIRFRFGSDPGPSRIVPRGFLVVARSPDALSRSTGIPREKIAGPFAGKLSNIADRVVLADPGGREADRVAYRRDGDWPARADGLGSSLQRVSADEPGDWARNWRVTFEGTRERAETVLLEDGAPVRWFENRNGSDPRFPGRLPWFHPDFDDAAADWAYGFLAVGFDTQGRGAQGWIRTDASPIAGLHSILVRAIFEVPARIPANHVPVLLMDWDDGFVAWLNGAEIARRNLRVSAPTPPPWTTAYLGLLGEAGGNESEAPSWRRVWIGRAADLRPGPNVLAIGNYNYGPRSSDLFAAARLVLVEESAASDSSPGRPSPFAASGAPPLVALIERIPAEATSADAVLLRARVEGRDVARVEVVHDLGPGTAEARATMEREVIAFGHAGGGPAKREGEVVYRASLPPAPDGAIVRFRIEARDARGGLGLFPREGNPTPWRAYLVIDRAPRASEDLRVFHISWSGTPRCGKGVWLRGSTFVDRGTAYLDVGVKYRGDTSCGRPKTGLKVKFNRGDLLDGQEELNLLAGWEDRSLIKEKMAWDLYRDVGLPACRAQPAAVYGPGPTLRGLYIALEEPGEDFLRRSGLGGSLWKCRNSLEDPMSAGGGFERLDGPDDLEGARAIEEFAGLLARLLPSSVTGRNAAGGSDTELFSLLEKHLDIEAFLDYQAVKCLTGDQDSFEKNWLLHRKIEEDAAGKPFDRWTVLPWDLDLSFGQTVLSDETVVLDAHPLLGTIDHGRHGHSWNGVIEAVFGRRSGDRYAKALYGRIWRMIDEKFRYEVLGPKIDRLDVATAEEGQADLELWPRWGIHRDLSYHRERVRAYVRARNDFLRRFLTSENSTSLASSAASAGRSVPGVPGVRTTVRTRTSYRTFRYVPGPHLKIAEISSRPEGGADLEFIEVRSLEPKEVDISGWDIPQVGYVFPPGSRIPAKGTIVVAKDPVKLAARHADLGRGRLFGPYPGRLPGKGGQIRLRDAGLQVGKRYYPETVDAVRYSSETPWPAVGHGRTLELRDPSLDNDLPESWRASEEKGGTPGR